MPNEALRQAGQDVPVDSSPTTDPTSTDESDNTNPGPDAGDHSGDSGGDDKSGGRGPDELRGEFDRRLKESDSKMDTGFARIEGMIAGMGQQQNTQPQGQVGNDLDSMSSAALEALRTGIPDDKLPAFEQLVAQKKSDERADARFNQNWTNQQTQQTRKESNAQAYQRYPELHDEASPLYRETNKVLDEMGGIVEHDPRSVLNASNEAATRLGVKPRSGAMYGAPSTRNHAPVGGRSAPAPDGSDGGIVMTNERAQEIGSRLAGALPSGKKFTTEQLKGIRERHSEYKKHQHLFIKQ